MSQLNYKNYTTCNYKLNNKFFESRPYSTVNIVNIIECVSYALCGRANHIPGFYPVILPVLVEDLQFPYTVV